jgi:hypothetical protein
MMMFSGVRSSWDIIARNSDFAWLAASAAVLACRSASSARPRSVISWIEPSTWHGCAQSGGGHRPKRKQVPRCASAVTAAARVSGGTTAAGSTKGWLTAKTRKRAPKPAAMGSKLSQTILSRAARKAGGETRADEGPTPLGGVLGWLPNSSPFSVPSAVIRQRTSAGQGQKPPPPVTPVRTRPPLPPDCTRAAAQRATRVTRHVS